MNKETQLREIKSMFAQLDRLRPNIPENTDSITELLTKLMEEVENYSSIVVHEKYGSKFDVSVLESDRQELLDMVKFAQTFPSVSIALGNWVHNFHENFGPRHAFMNSGGTLPSAEIVLREGGEVTSDFVESVQRFSHITGSNVSIFSILGEVFDDRWDSDDLLYLVVGGEDFSRAIIVPSYSLEFVKNQSSEVFEMISIPLCSALEDIQTKIYLPRPITRL